MGFHFCIEINNFNAILAWGLANTLQPDWKKWTFNSVHSRTFHECNFHDRRCPCVMQLAHLGLVNTKKETKNTNKWKDTYWKVFRDTVLIGVRDAASVPRARNIKFLNFQSTTFKFHDISEPNGNIFLDSFDLWGTRGLRKFKLSPESD